MDTTEIISKENSTYKLKEKYYVDKGVNINAEEMKQLWKGRLNKKTWRNRLYVKRGKKLFEMFLLCLVCLPVLLIIFFIFLILLLPNKGKIIFKQKRIGLNGKPFTIFKFKTLTNPIEVELEKDIDVIKNNSHVFGMFLRKTGLDEIPQFINVIKGDMNIIGPRPLPYKDIVHLSDYQFIKRHMIKPGICGLWQIKRKYFNDISSLRYDDFYMEKQSLLFDIRIIFSSILYMIKGKGR